MPAMRPHGTEQASIQVLPRATPPGATFCCRGGMGGGARERLDAQVEKTHAREGAGTSRN